MIFDKFDLIRLLGITSCTVLFIPTLVLTIGYYIFAKNNGEYYRLSDNQRLYLSAALTTVIMLFIGNVFLK